MYTTIEADLENGQLKGVDLKQLPSHAHVLITLLTTPTKKQTNKYNFSDIAGKLQWQGDALKVQRELRNEW